MRRDHRWKTVLRGVGRKVGSVRERRGRRRGIVRKVVRFVLCAVFGDVVVRCVGLLVHFLANLFSG